jgi:hypothetical protein
MFVTCGKHLKILEAATGGGGKIRSWSCLALEIIQLEWQMKGCVPQRQHVYTSAQETVDQQER